jgi:hypothetical protein
MKYYFIALFLGVIVLAAGVAAYTFVKVGSTYKVTLDNGHNVTVLSVDYNRPGKTITATINKTKLTIEDVYLINKVTQDIQNQLDKKKNAYSLSVVAQT